MKISKILVKTKSKKYPIYIGMDVLKNIEKIIKLKLSNTKKIAIIFDKNLPNIIIKNLKLSLKNYEVKTYKLNPKNKIKDIKIAISLVENLIKNNFNRSDCVIALGGGVVGDLSAFVSSITKRGINFVNIPTTLLAQVDASIGGKTAVNSKQGKNLIGTFHQPEFVIIDISLLKTLPYREMICGYGEILKHSLILDKKFFLWLTKNSNNLIKKNNNILKSAIINSCKIKARIVNIDERENNIRKILNFGHTFGHAYEATKNFSKKLNHGEAVLLGMISASELSFKRGILNSNDLFLIKKLYLNLKLPLKISKFFKKKDINKIVNFMIKDKKNINKKISIIFLKKIGRAIISKKSFFNIKEIKKFLLLELRK